MLIVLWSPINVCPSFFRCRLNFLACTPFFLRISQALILANSYGRADLFRYVAFFFSLASILALGFDAVEVPVAEIRFLLGTFQVACYATNLCMI